MQQGKVLTHQMKSGARQRPRKKQVLCWVSHSPKCLIYSYFLPILIFFLSSRLLPCYKDIRMAKTDNEGLTFCRSRMDFYPHMPSSLQIPLLFSLHESQLGHFPDTWVQSLYHDPQFWWQIIFYVRTPKTSWNFT